MTTQTLRDMVDCLKALGHPARLRILALLREGELCVCQVAEVLALAPSTVSEHLSILRRSGFVEEHKEGKWVFYALTSDRERLALCDSLWVSLAGEATLAADLGKCAEVRAMPLLALCRPGGSPAQRLPMAART
ncbi:MAG TPA: metalloregulator ArsR/SmtB family transcription factor [Holophaga sp.]|nr:metalloregulator ArsR/SmtB family transcription factor [Holophaga sp.]